MPIVMVLGLLTAEIVATATPALASSTLCSGFTACEASPYTDHSWQANVGNSYWGQFSGDNCTNYVAYYEQAVNGMSTKRPSWLTVGGNADAWASEATAGGITVSSTPVVGAVAQWGDYGWNDNNGHVGIVEKVVSSTTIDVSWDSYSAGPYKWVSLNSTDANTSSAVGWPSNFIYLGITTGGVSNKFRAAFQANNGNLYTFDSAAGAAATGQGMANGTSPAVTAVAAGHEEAFQAAGTNHLYVYGDVSTGDTQQGMASGTSPSIAAQSNGNSFEVAFQANNGNLYTYQHTSSGDTVTPTSWGLWPGTSPAIAVLNTGQYEIAFMAAGTGDLYVWGPDGIINTGQGMAAGTSPSIGGGSGGGYVVSFQANTGYLYFFNSGHVTSPTNQGMASGTSPATAAPSSGGYETVFQAAGTNYMYTYGNYSTGNTQQGMLPGTSPAITGLSGGFEAAFEANTGNLFVYSSATGSAADTQQGIASGTSPAIG